MTDRTVHIFDKQGRVLRVLRQHPRDSHGVCQTGQDGSLVVADCSARCVFVLSPGGSIRHLLTQCGNRPFKQPRYVAVNQYSPISEHAGDIIVSDSELNCVAIFSEDGRLVSLYDQNSNANKDLHMNQPNGVCTDRSGNILICDSGNDRVIMLNYHGEFVFELLSSKDVTKPQDIAVTPDEQLVVAEWGGMIRVFKYKEPI